MSVSVGLLSIESARVLVERGNGRHGGSSGMGDGDDSEDSGSRVGRFLLDVVLEFSPDRFGRSFLTKFAAGRFKSCGPDDVCRDILSWSERE